MSTVLLCSASGSPGVTVTSLGLALTWPRDVVLVDADRTPSQAVLAGYLRGESSQGRGMPGLLQAHREGQHLIDAFDAQSMTLPDLPRRRPRRGDEVDVVKRRFVPGFVRPGTIELFNPVWRGLGQAFADMHPDVIVDAGRIGTRGLPQELVDAVDRVLVVTRTSLPALAAVRLYLAPLREQVDDADLGLILVGPGRPYPAREVAAQFGLPVTAEIPWEPRGADDLHQGNPIGASWWGQRLGAAYSRASGAVGVRSTTELYPAEATS